MFGTAAGDTLVGDASSNVMTGGDGDDVLDGGSGADVFIGGAGNDTIIGEGSDDKVVLRGSIAAYLIEFDGATVKLTHNNPSDASVNDGVDTVQNVETFVFSDLEVTRAELQAGLQVWAGGASLTSSNPTADQRDFLIASSASNAVTLDGGAGDDNLVGGAFGDTLNGGSGDDVLNGGSGGADTFIGGAGQDTVTFATRTSGPAQIDMSQSGAFTPNAAATGVESVVGSRFGDWIFGSSNGTSLQKLSGGDGDDVIRGFGGNDHLEGGTGNDVLIGDGGTNNYSGGDGRDVFVVSRDASTIIDGGSDLDFVEYGGSSRVVPVVSTFDSNADGWTILGASGGFQPSGGNDGGTVRGTDTAGSAWVFVAPDKFLGDQSGAFGGALEFDLYHEPTGSGYVVENDIIIVGNGEAIVIPVANPPQAFTTFSLALNAAAGWTYTTDLTGLTGTAAPQAWTTAAGAAATNAQIASILADITAIHIRGDYSYGADSTRLDNVILRGAAADEQQMFEPIAWTTTYQEFPFLQGDFNGWSQVNFSGLTKTTETQPVTPYNTLDGIEGGDFGTAGHTWYFEAASKFQGDKSDHYGGTLSFRLRTDAGVPSSDSLVLLTGNGITLRMDASLGSRAWQTFSFDLHAGAGWKVGSSNTNATEAQIRTVLANLEGIFIRGDHGVGQTSQLDDVALRGVATASPLDGVQDILDQDHVPGFAGHIEFDALSRAVERYNRAGVLVATDQLTSVEGVGGSQSDDVFHGALGSQADHVQMLGRGGDDTLHEGTGSQRFFGESGNDTVFINSGQFSASEAFHGGEGRDTLDLRSVANVAWRVIDFSGLANGGYLVTRTGDVRFAMNDADRNLGEVTSSAALSSFETIHGGELADEISTEADLVFGNGGDDWLVTHNRVGQRIFGGDGDDFFFSFWYQEKYLYGGNGNDYFEAIGSFLDPAGQQTINGGAGDDILITTAGHIDVNGGAGSDTLQYEGGSISSLSVGIEINLLTGEVDGGAAFATIANIENLVGTSNDDMLIGDHQSNILSGKAGNDVLNGIGQAGSADPDAADDSLFGNEGDDTLIGQAGDDVLHGGAGNDSLLGGVGNDTASYMFYEEAGFGFDHETVGLIGSVSVNLSSSAPAVFTPVLVDEAFEFSASGWTTAQGSATANDISHDPDLSGFLNIDGAGAATKVTRSFDFSGPGFMGIQYTGQITIAFDFYEIDSWSGQNLTVELGALGQVFAESFDNVASTAPDAARSGTWAGGTWSITAVSTGHVNLVAGATADDIHHVVITANLAGPQFDLSFITDTSGVAGIDNLQVTGHAENDAFASIENVIGGDQDDVLVGNAAANALSGSDGDDTIDGRGGDDYLLDGEGADIVNGGLGNDRVLVGIGSNEIHARGDVYNGGAGTDTLDYSGLAAGMRIRPDSGTHEITYQIDVPVWADTDTTEQRLFAETGEHYTPLEIWKSFDGTQASSGLDVFRRLNLDSYSSLTDPLSLIKLEPRMVTVRDRFSGFEAFVGTLFDDTFVASSLVDTFDGNLGQDLLSYAASVAGVTVNLNTGTGSGGFAADDTFSGFERVLGSAHDDRIYGDSATNVLYGGSGDDVISGGAGSDRLLGGLGSGDRVSYASSSAGVSVNLSTNAVSGGDAAGDVISDFEGIFGSTYSDRLFGDGATNVILGLGGNDIIRGGAGADVLGGGNGIDTLSYAGSGAGVTVILSRGAVKGGHAAGDSVSGFEHVDGSRHDDRLLGDAGNNRLNGSAGNDTIHGGAGADRIIGGAGRDSVAGGTGGDTFVLLPHATAFDVITDFVAADDQLEVSARVFGGGLVAGALPAGRFVANATGLAGDANDRFVLDTSTGNLYFDANGSDAGGRSLIARFTGMVPALTASDFDIV